MDGIDVVAVGNGDAAMRKIPDLRPDLVLADIFMPVRNGYEVCEFVKSHPEFRSIPVVLLTGTFEPFDPDRADKAGCDAVVTKPFESQGLIHKVEELINASHAAPAPAPAVEEPAPAAVPESPWADDANSKDIFGAAPSEPPVSASDMPFDQEKGTRNIRVTIEDVDGLPISESDRKKIYEDNARRLLRLVVGR